MKMLCRIKLFILRLLLRKEEQTRTEIYDTLIIKSVKTFDQVPAIIQPKVKAVLEALDLGELAQQEINRRTMLWIVQSLELSTKSFAKE